MVRWRLQLSVVLCVVLTAVAVYTSDASPLHWQTLAWMSLISVAGGIVMRLFPRVFVWPALMVLLMRLVMGPFTSASRTFRHDLHEFSVILAVFSGVASLMEYWWPQPLLGPSKSSGSPIPTSR